ncbi:uncharacterized protein LOC135148479 [Daucus carota subsp. sativus]|uniref:uncharacterized protein LOC135148479 n=1 Tax=Daucus carota subsp. sativus TaxID=79200 RepID=UPI003082A8E0
MHENRQVIYFSRFCQLLFNATIDEVDFDVDDEIKPFRLHKRVFKDLISKDEKYPIQRPLLIPAQVRVRMDMPPVQHQQPQQPQPPVSPTIPKQPRTSASRSKKATKSDENLSTKQTRTSVATQVLKTKSDKPANFDAGAIVHDTAPENYKSDAVVDQSDKVALEALQSLAKAGEEPSKSQSEAQEKSAQNPVENVANPASDNDEDDESSDDDNDQNDEVPQSHLQQKWESTSQGS